MEPLENRIKRFQNGRPAEIIDTLLNSINNFFNNEIKEAVQDGRYQTYLAFLGIHAVALTVSDAFFDKKPPEGYKVFLEKFVDGETPDTKFSEIAEILHAWRNILAHQWLGVGGYKIGFDYVMEKGWEKREKIIFINPRIYCNYYLKSFAVDGKIWDYGKMLEEEELLQIKERLLKKFLTR